MAQKGWFVLTLVLASTVLVGVSYGRTETQTRYFVYDENMEYSLALNEGSVWDVGFWSESGDLTVYYGISVWHIHANGTGEKLSQGDMVAVVSRSTDGEGYQYATWQCPETRLEQGDTIEVTLEIKVGTSLFDVGTFPTETFNAGWLNATTWNVHYYTKRTYDGTQTTGYIYFGTPQYSTRISGFIITIEETETLQPQQKPPVAGPVPTYPLAVTVVDWKGSTFQDVNVTAFQYSTNTTFWKLTNQNGTVSFELPIDYYQVKAEVEGEILTSGWFYHNKNQNLTLTYTVVHSIVSWAKRNWLITTALMCLVLTLVWAAKTREEKPKYIPELRK